jgi:hypothetical protein
MIITFNFDSDPRRKINAFSTHFAEIGASDGTTLGHMYGKHLFAIFFLSFYEGQKLSLVMSGQMSRRFYRSHELSL